MTSRAFITLLLPFVVLLGAQSASASVINFSSLSSLGTPISGPLGSFLQQGGAVSLTGFTFTSTFADFGLSVWQAGDPSQPVGGAAATSLFEYQAGDTTTSTRTGGGGFRLDGIDLTQWGQNMPGGPGTCGVTFLGTKTDLSIVSQTFQVARSSGSPILQSFVFSGISDLTSVSSSAAIAQLQAREPFSPIGPNRAACIDYLGQYQRYLDAIQSQRQSCSSTMTGQEKLVRTGPACEGFTGQAAGSLCWSVPRCASLDESWFKAALDRPAKFGSCMASIVIPREPTASPEMMDYHRMLIRALQASRMSMQVSSFILQSDRTFASRMSRRLTDGSLKHFAAIHEAAMDELVWSFDQIKPDER